MTLVGAITTMYFCWYRDRETERQRDKKKKGEGQSDRHTVRQGHRGRENEFHTTDRQTACILNAICVELHLLQAKRCHTRVCD